MKTAEMKTLGWDEVQEKIRSYADHRDFDVLPDNYLSLSDAHYFNSLKLFNEGVLLPILECYPFFQSDSIRVKHITIEYEEDDAIADLLKDLGI